MTYIELLKADMVQAMKDKDKDKLTVIRLAKGAIDKEHIDKKREINDELVIEVISREIKQRKESIEEFKKGNRQDLVDKTEEEIQILNKYLPEQLDSKEVEEIIDEAVTRLKPEGMRDMKNIMQDVSAKLKGRADMKMVSNLIRSKLS